MQGLFAATEGHIHTQKFELNSNFSNSNFNNQSSKIKRKNEFNILNTDNNQTAEFCFFGLLRVLSNKSQQKSTRVRIKIILSN